MAVTRVVLVLGLLIASHSAVAAGREPYRLVEQGCVVKVKSGNKWQVVDSPWTVGQTVLGLRGSSNPSVIYLYAGGRQYAAFASCWKTVSGAEVPVQSAQHQVGISYLNWQERVTLLSTADGVRFSLRANQAGWGLYYLRELPLRGNLKLGAMVSLFSAGSAVLNSNADGSGGLTYKSLDASAFGAMVAPEISWQREGQSETRGPSFGLMVPVAFRVTNWASVPGYEMQDTRRFLFGPMLSLRLQRPGWEFSSRLGFWQNLQNFAWVAGIGRIL